MRFRLREIETESKFSQALSVDAISQAVPVVTVHEVLAAEGFILKGQ